MSSMCEALFKWAAYNVQSNFCYFILFSIWIEKNFEYWIDLNISATDDEMWQKIQKFKGSQCANGRTLATMENSFYLSMYIIEYCLFKIICRPFFQDCNDRRSCFVRWTVWPIQFFIFNDRELYPPKKF